MLIDMGGKAKKSARQLANLASDKKNAALEEMASLLRENYQNILSANKIDVEAAEKGGVRKAMIDRLMLSKERIDEMADALLYLAGLEDPVGKILGGSVRPNGLEIKKITTPLGVVGIIYESRPNVTVDCAALCLKSGNACILRGGKDAINSNIELVRIMRLALQNGGLSPDCIQLVEDISRQTATEMMRLNGYIDVLIPRGGAELIQSVVQNATIPVIETGTGNCHIFVDEFADFLMAVDIVNNAKTSRPGVCNAAETLLVDKRCAEAFLPLIKHKLDQSGVELRGCKETVRILGNSVKDATEEDYFEEYNDYIMAVRVVEDIDQAIDHIDKYSTKHSEAIVTNCYANAQKFTKQVDSAAVYVNASTRFTDGAMFGLGAEIGISTQKLHARGPMGLLELCSYKYIVFGSGNIR